MHSSNDIIYMKRALQLASKGQYTARPNPLVGCIIVQDGKIVGEGCHWQAGQAHAEILALDEAKEKARGATCYVTLEPCPHWGRTGPCINPLRESGVKRVVIAVLDPNPLVSGKGKAALEEAGIAVEVGLCSKQAIALNKGFFSRMQRRRPYVRAKVAMSLDGRIALANGKSQWITSEDARRDGHFVRARSCAILTGSQTVQKDNCRLTFRGDLPDLPPDISFEQPWRLLIDSHLSCDPQAAIFSAPGKTAVFITEKSVVKQEQMRDVVVLNEKEGYVDLEALLTWCSQNEINDLLVESGGVLTGALVKAGLIDELMLYVAPKLLGHDAKPMAFLPEIAQLDQIAGRFEKIECLGNDLKITLSLSEFARAFYEHS